MPSVKTSGDDEHEAEQAEVGEQRGPSRGRHEVALDELHPPRRVLERVERGAAEEHRGDRDQAGPDRGGVEVRQRAADHQLLAAAAPHRHPRDQRGVDLERVGVLVEGVAEQRAAEQHRRGVDRAPQPHRSELGGERVDQLHPHEQVEAERGRPVAEPLGIDEHAWSGSLPVSCANAALMVRTGLIALYAGPNSSEAARSRPRADVEDPEERVDQAVLAADRDHHGVAEGEHAERPQTRNHARESTSAPARPAPAGRSGRRRSAGYARRSPAP